MRRLAILVALLAVPLGGCLRSSFDLCDRADPHPECDAGRPFDAGSDAEVDSGPGPEDAGPEDAGPEDADIAVDAGTDAGLETDAAPPDAGGDASADAAIADADAA